MSQTMNYCVFSIPRAQMKTINNFYLRFYGKKFYRTTLVLANQWVDIFTLNDNKHLLDEAMSNMNIYSVEPRNIRRG